MRFDSRVKRLERQQPERKIVFAWQDEPLPDDIDNDTLIIRFVWVDIPARPESRSKNK